MDVQFMNVYWTIDNLILTGLVCSKKWDTETHTRVIKFTAVLSVGIVFPGFSSSQ